MSGTPEKVKDKARAIAQLYQATLFAESNEQKAEDK
jgi:hypothetical protein